MKKVIYALVLTAIAGCSTLQAGNDGWIDLFDGKGILSGFNLTHATEVS